MSEEATGYEKMDNEVLEAANRGCQRLVTVVGPVMQLRYTRAVMAARNPLLLCKKRTVCCLIWIISCPMIQNNM